MFRFENIEYLYALLAIPVLAVLFWIWMGWRKIAAKRFGERRLINQLTVDLSRYKHITKFVFIALAFSFLIVGLMNPQIGSKMEKVKRQGVDVVIAIDVSKSMMAEDVKPNRLERTKQYVSRLISKLQNDRVGLIVFAGRAYLQMPLTVDYAAAKMFLSTMNTEMVPTQGTAIGASITQAIQAFKAGEQKHKVLVIITDGENHQDDAIELAKEAAKEGVVIHTIGVGSVNGAPIPIYRRNIQVDFKRDKEGNVVLSKLNEIMLNQLALTANGQYWHLTSSQDDLEGLVKAIASMEKKDFEERIFTDYEDKFQFFLAIGLALLTLEFFISERKSKWLSRISIKK